MPTIEEVINNIVEDTAKKAGDGPDVLEELGAFLAPYLQEADPDVKIPGRKLFSLCDRLVKERPDFVAATLAIGVLAKYGVDTNRIDMEDISANNYNMNIEDIMDMDQ